MGKDRFDFSEIDAALPAAERMQEKDRLTDALENNYRAVGILGDRVEKLESRLSEVLPGLDEAISSLGGASKITISAESRRVLEQEGEAICRKMAEGINKESVRLLNHLSMRDCVVISATAFWCMIEVIIFLLAAFICTCMTNAEFIHIFFSVSYFSKYPPSLCFDLLLNLLIIRMIITDVLFSNCPPLSFLVL